MVNTRLYKIANRMYLEGLCDEMVIMHSLEDTIGGHCSRASTLEDIKDHIDFYWRTPNDVMIPIDAKGLHKNKRKDKEYSDNHWIEVQNVKGEQGWIFGKAKYIAFRTKDSVLFVEPQRLVDLYTHYVAHKEVVHTVPSDYYIPYQRNGRKDLIFKVPNSLLREISSFIVDL